MQRMDTLTKSDWNTRNLISTTWKQRFSQILLQNLTDDILRYGIISKVTSNEQQREQITGTAKQNLVWQAWITENQLTWCQQSVETNKQEDLETQILEHSSHKTHTHCWKAGHSAPNLEVLVEKRGCENNTPCQTGSNTTSKQLITLGDNAKHIRDHINTSRHRS